MRYISHQVLRGGWYGTHYLASKRLSAGTDRPDEPEYQFRYERPSKLLVWQDYLEAFLKDYEHAAQGLYSFPKDLRRGALSKAVKLSNQYFKDLRSVDQRRINREGTEVRVDPKFAQQNRRYPAYYQQNFHYQTDGWLSEKSAQLYETQVEILFSGAAGPMRRLALAAIGRELKNRKITKLDHLELGCGTGQFLCQVKENFPHINLTGIDLSEPYLEKARETLTGFNQIELLQAAAENLPLADQSVDMINAIYLFHELPPKIRRQVFSEIARVLRPGGLFILADPSSLVIAGWIGCSNFFSGNFMNHFFDLI